jgi:hypothetical protein
LHIDKAGFTQVYIDSTTSDEIDFVQPFSKKALVYFDEQQEIKMKK